MKIIKPILKLLIALIIIFFVAMGIRLFTVENNLTELKTKHFLIEYKGIYKSNAEEIAESLENNYDRIRAELKDPEHETIKVFLHGNQTDFNEKSGLTNSANGTSRGPKEFHVLWTNWFNRILPDNPKQTAVHEFTHCVQLNILIKQALTENMSLDEVDFNKSFEKKFQENYPQWFWEAISIYQAGEFNGLEVKYAKRNNPNLESLTKSNQIYRIGYTIVEYIVSTWGVEKLPELISTYCDTEKVLNVNKTEFESGWKNFVNKKY